MTGDSLYRALVCACSASSVVSDSLRPHGLKFSRFLCPWNFPGKNTGVGCTLSSRGYSRPKDRTHVSGVSYTAGRFFTTDPIRETLYNFLSFIRGSQRDFLSLFSLQPSFLPPASDRSALPFNTLCSFTRIKGLNAEEKLATNLSGSFLASSGLLETCVLIQPFTTQGKF